LKGRGGIRGLTLPTPCIQSITNPPTPFPGTHTIHKAPNVGEAVTTTTITTTTNTAYIT
jgi:hypothetical protein